MTNFNSEPVEATQEEVERALEENPKEETNLQETNQILSGLTETAGNARETLSEYAENYSSQGKELIADSSKTAAKGVAKTGHGLWKASALSVVATYKASQPLGRLAKKSGKALIGSFEPDYNKSRLGYSSGSSRSRREFERNLREKYPDETEESEDDGRVRINGPL